MIIQFSVPKTGSTLVCEILLSLHKDGILKDPIRKTHRIVDLGDKVNWKDYKIVTTIRHPGDTICSEFNTWKRGVSKIDDNIDNFQKAVESIAYRMEIIEMLEEKPNNILCLRYEEFYDNFEYIYDQLEKFFNITINRNLRDKYNKLYHRDNVFKFVSRQDDYKGNLTNTAFTRTELLEKGVPAHMSYEKGKQNKYKNLPDSYLQRLKTHDRIKRFCDKFNYSI